VCPVSISHVISRTLPRRLAPPPRPRMAADMGAAATAHAAAVGNAARAVTGFGSDARADAYPARPSVRVW
ncbi:MAG TPA: hypothetical protein VFD74_00410, partial [Thermoleophilia bacterium]|nr:hypothetical protein [Thermoleophilia bacterium]